VHRVFGCCLLDLDVSEGLCNLLSYSSRCVYRRGLKIVLSDPLQRLYVHINSERRGALVCGDGLGMKSGAWKHLRDLAFKEEG
jgi:hypothetical protein